MGVTRQTQTAYTLTNLCSGKDHGNRFTRCSVRCSWGDLVHDVYIRRLSESTNGLLFHSSYVLFLHPSPPDGKARDSVRIVDTPRGHYTLYTCTTVSTVLRSQHSMGTNSITYQSSERGPHFCAPIKHPGPRHLSLQYRRQICSLPLSGSMLKSRH